MTAKKKSAKKAPAKKKKKPRLAEAVATPKAVHDALKVMIGLSDHAPENEGREFTFVITNEIFGTLGNPKRVQTGQIRTPGFLKALQEEFIPKYVKEDYTKYSVIHEIISVEDQSDDVVWIEVTLKILNICVSRASDDSFDYYRKAEIAANRAIGVSAAEHEGIWSFEYE